MRDLIATSDGGHRCGARALASAGFVAALASFALACCASTALGAALPDNRAYELVSTGTGEPFAPTTPLNSRFTEVNSTELPFQSSEDGESVTYAGEPALIGGVGDAQPSEGNQWLAHRTAEGWSATAITPETGIPGETGIINIAGYQAFSPDLSTQILFGPEHAPLTAEVPVGCQSLYTRDPGTGAYHALFTPSEAPSPRRTDACGRPLFVGVTGDRSTVIFQSEAALTPNAQEATEPPPTRIGSEQRETAGTGCMFGCNLYEATAGHLRLVNVLPGGEVAPSATFGGYPGPRTDFTKSDLADFSNAISEDGSRIFWTDTQVGPLSEHLERVYALENGTTSVQVSGAGPAEYWTATPDGRYAYYTEAGRLWQFDTATNSRTPITAAGAGVQGVIGTNQVGEDGSFIYFVAGGALAPGAAPKLCESINAQRAQIATEREEGLISLEEAAARRDAVSLEEEEEDSGGTPPNTGCNLYVQHEGHTILIATLSPSDNEVGAGGNSGSGRISGDWKANLGERTAEVTSDGRHLVFQSVRPLTGYNGEVTLHRIVEAFVYSAVDSHLSCVSCDPAGAPPSVQENVGAGVSFLENRLPVSLEDNTYTHRWMSADGDRVFFDSEQPLAQRDDNGTQDVYEWEREGTAECPSATSVFGGCVFLLSGANTRGYSFFVDADATGANVFFEHVGPLGTVEATAGRNELYDARVDGGFSGHTAVCVGTACQVSPAPPPNFATPPSSTLSGAGNFPPPSPPVTKHEPSKRLTSAQKLAKAIHACRKKRDRSKRRGCERQAHRRYGAARGAPKSMKGASHQPRRRS